MTSVGTFPLASMARFNRQTSPSKKSLSDDSECRSANLRREPNADEDANEKSWKDVTTMAEFRLWAVLILEN